MVEPAPRRSDIAAALRAIFELPRRDQLYAFSVLREYLAGAIEREGDLDAEIRRRQETLDALRRAADELKLPEGQGLTTPQYETTEEASQVSISQIIRAWGSWRQAQAALTGGWVPESPAQRSLRRALSGRRRSTEDYLAGVREWLATNPASPILDDYDNWARDRNQRRRRGQPPVVGAVGVVKGLALGWKDVMDVARGAATLSEKQRERANRLLPPDARNDDLIGSSGVGLLVGLRPNELADATRISGFPAPVARVSTNGAWEVGDIRAYAAGEPVPSRTRYERQNEVMDVRELASRLGIAPVM